MQKFLLFLLWGLSLTAQAQQKPHDQSLKTMTIDVWSDVVCPFCYIGKRHLESALKELPEGVSVTVRWHSFQLDPDTKTTTDKDAYRYLAERKGISYEQSKQLHQQVINMAKQAGLEYRFDKAVVANTFQAHRLLQLAKQAGKDNEMEERLFSAYFTEGKNIDDPQVLHALGAELGLSAADITKALEDQSYATAVKADIQQAQAIGIQGVPYFIINQEFAISGAQPVSVFVKTLENAYKKSTPPLQQGE